MKFGLNKGGIALLSLLLFCISCGDTDLFDTDKWSGKVDGWEPAIKGKIVSGEFSLWDLLRDTAADSPIQREPMEPGSTDSVLVIKYTKDSIYKVNISDVFELSKTDILFAKTIDVPDELKNPGQGGIDVGTVFPGGYDLRDSVEQVLPFPDEFAGTQLKQIKLSGGSCEYLLPKLNAVKYTIKVSYLSEGQMKVLIEETEAAGATWKSIALKDKIFDLVDNKIKLKFEVKLKEGIYEGADFNIQIKFLNYDYSMIEGKIVKAGGIAIPEDSFDMDVDFLNDISGNFSFTDPRLELAVKNKGLGLPVAVNLIFEGQNKDGKKGKLTLHNPLLFAGNSSLTNKTEAQRVDRNNSTIVDFLSLPPQGNIDYSGSVTLNPEGKNNVIYKEGTLDMDVHISIPLAFTGSLSYADTLTDIDIDQKITDKILSGRIVMNILENGLPLALSVPKLVFLGEDNRQIDVILVKSTTDDKGVIDAGKTGRLVFEINQAQAKNLGLTKNILLQAAISGETGKPVKSDAKVKFALTLEAKASINDLDDF